MSVDGCGVVFGDAPEPLKSMTAVDQAADLLMSLLASSPVRSTEIYAEMEGAGISRKSALRAKKKIGITIKKIGKHWFWSLPAREEPQMFEGYPLS